MAISMIARIEPTESGLKLTKRMLCSRSSAKISLDFSREGTPVKLLAIQAWTSFFFAQPAPTATFLALSTLFFTQVISNHTCSYGNTVDGYALFLHCEHEGELETPQFRVQVQHVDMNPVSWCYLGLSCHKEETKFALS